MIKSFLMMMKQIQIQIITQISPLKIPLSPLHHKKNLIIKTYNNQNK